MVDEVVAVVQGVQALVRAGRLRQGLDGRERVGAPLRGEGEELAHSDDERLFVYVGVWCVWGGVLGFRWLIWRVRTTWSPPNKEKQGRPRPTAYLEEAEDGIPVRNGVVDEEDQVGLVLGGGVVQREPPRVERAPALERLGLLHGAL